MVDLITIVFVAAVLLQATDPSRSIDSAWFDAFFLVTLTDVPARIDFWDGVAQVASLFAGLLLIVGGLALILSVVSTRLSERRPTRWAIPFARLKLSPQSGAVEGPRRTRESGFRRSEVRSPPGRSRAEYLFPCSLWGLMPFTLVFAVVMPVQQKPDDHDVDHDEDCGGNSKIGPDAHPESLREGFRVPFMRPGLIGRSGHPRRHNRGNGATQNPYEQPAIEPSFARRRPYDASFDKHRRTSSRYGARAGRIGSDRASNAAAGSALTLPPLDSNPLPPSEFVR